MKLMLESRNLVNVKPHSLSIKGPNSHASHHFNGSIYKTLRHGDTHDTVNYFEDFFSLIFLKRQIQAIRIVQSIAWYLYTTVKIVCLIVSQVITAMAKAV